MKNLMFLFAIAMISFSCQKYEFMEEKDEVLSTEIQLKGFSQNKFTSVDTANVAIGIQVIMKAVTITGNPSQWNWDFGDGTVGESQQVDHLYNMAGTYNISVTATDGTNSAISEIVIVVGSGTQAIFSLHSSSQPNSQGQIKYIVSGFKGQVPNPPVPATGPFGYEGSNLESNWDVVSISQDTSSTRVYWEVLTYNSVYSQAYGGFNNTGDFIWAVMNDSKFFSNSYNHLRVGFLNGQIVKEENFQIGVLGDSGDAGEIPQIRFEVIDSQNLINIYINIIDFTPGVIYSPKVRFKVKEGDAWSNQQNTEWVGGTGYVKYTTAINEFGEYRLRVEPDQNSLGTYTQMTGSKFYKLDENCFVWQFVNVN